MPQAKTLEKTLAAVLARWPSLSWQERLRDAAKLKGKTVFSTSLGYEDQALFHVIAREKLGIATFTLDTGRLFPETYTLLQKTEAAYGVRIATYFPDAKAVESYANEHGINGFYDAVEKRKACCHIRKVEPLNRALKGAHHWVSGLRAEQSEGRSHLPFAEIDAARGILKLYPLLDVADADIRDFIAQEKILINPLHAHGFPSIGCAPCTRAIEAGEHPRAGRWWWEQQSGGECGLHVVDGKLVPIKKGQKPHA